MRKNKPNPKLTAAEQDRVNKEWERANKQKLPSGESAKIAEGDYESWKSGKSHGTYYMGPEEKPKPTTVGKLPTKKLDTSSAKATLQKQPSRKKTTPTMDPKFKPEAKTKKLTRTGTATGNVATSVRNVVNKAKFEREKKLSAASKRATSTLGRDTGNRMSELKDQKKVLKSIKKDKTISRSTIKPVIKDTRKAIKLEKIRSSKK